MSSELQDKYHAELARLDGELAHYERQWTLVPRFAWVTVLAPIAGLVWGVAALFVALLVTLALVGVRAYLIAMRRSEIAWNRERLVADLQTSVAPSGSRQQLA